MRNPKLMKVVRCAIAGAISVALLGACRPKPPEAPPAPEPPPPAVTAPAAGEPAAEVAPAAAEPAATPANGTATPAGATATVKSGSKLPALDSMQFAQPSAKLGAPVDLRYVFDGSTLYLAAVPQVSGGDLRMSVSEEPLIVTTATALTAQKAAANTAYRQQFSVTRLPGAPSTMKVLVTMDLPDARVFSHFTVPLDGAVVADKQQVIRQQ